MRFASDNSLDFHTTPSGFHLHSLILPCQTFTVLFYLVITYRIKMGYLFQIQQMLMTHIAHNLPLARCWLHSTEQTRICLCPFVAYNQT